MGEMKWIKLTLLEAGFLKDTFSDFKSGEARDNDEIDIAIELLDGAIDNAVEESLDDE